jgi:hypothetical protein
MKKEDVSLLSHIVKSLGEAEGKLEESYEKKDQEMFVKSKKLILNLQKKMEEVLR